MFVSRFLGLRLIGFPENLRRYYIKPSVTLTFGQVYIIEAPVLQLVSPISDNAESPIQQTEGFLLYAEDVHANHTMAMTSSCDEHMLNIRLPHTLKKLESGMFGDNM